MSNNFDWKKSQLLVGTIVTADGLRRMAKPVKAADLLEVRVDALLASGIEPEGILNALRKRKNRVLLTLRLPAEGGVYPWESGERKALFTALLPDVDAIDIEFAAAKELASILALAKRRGVAVVLSAHSIHGPATPATLKKWHQQMPRFNPVIAKIAVQIKKRSDLAALALILLTAKSQRWAVMGLGPLGSLSRIVLGSLGSALVYGYLDKPAAPGQPSLKELHSSPMRHDCLQ